MTRTGLLGALAAPLLIVPAIGWALMEFGPERSIVFAMYPLMWALAFLIAGIVGMLRRPHSPVGAILRRAALWATGGTLGITAVLLAASIITYRFYR